MPPLTKLWQAIENVPGAAAVMADWRARLGEEVALVRSLLQATDQFAESFPDSDDPHSSYRVVMHAPDDFVGVHDSGGATIALEKRDVLIYRIDQRRIGSSVAAAFGFEVVEATVDGVPHTARIGTFRPFAGFAFPVYFAIPLESTDLMHAIEVVSSQSDNPFIMVAPTARRLRPTAETLLKQRNACFLTLAESITTNSTGKWTATPAATQLLSAFQQAVVPQAKEAAAMAFFPTLATATWRDVRIKFVDGETVSIKVGDAGGRFLYSQMGMADKRSAKPTTQWRLLESFAKRYGILTWDSPDASPKNQKRRENLSRDLKKFFRIEGDPIEFVQETKGWRTIFSVEPDA